MKHSKLNVENTHQYPKKLYRHKSHKKGNALLLALLIISFVLIPFTFYMIEKMIMFETFRYIDKRVVISALAGLSQIDQTKTAYGELDLNELGTRNIFIQYLKKNLELDDNLIPINQAKNYGQIRIKELEVYTNSELPAKCSWNSDIQYPAIHVVIETDVKVRLLKQIYGNTLTMTIHRDVDIYTKY